VENTKTVKRALEVTFYDLQLCNRLERGSSQFITLYSWKISQMQFAN